MSKIDKLVADLKVKPAPSNFRWEDLITVLEHYGYVKTNGSGSRRKFYNKEKNALIICHEPHPAPSVDKGCIKDVVTHLKEYKFI